MICKYFADDGTEFDDYDECEAYEHRQKTINAVQLSRFWDEDRKPMTLERFIGEPEACDYMEIANDDEAARIKEFCRNDAGIMSPWAYNEEPVPGRYYYSHSEDNWHNFDTDYNEILRILNIFEG